MSPRKSKHEPEKLGGNDETNVDVDVDVLCATLEDVEN
jgi:hypothetical protein